MHCTCHAVGGSSRAAIAADRGGTVGLYWRAASAAVRLLSLSPCIE